MSIVDPYTTTREVFTNHLLDREIPADAHPTWLDIHDKLCNLYRKLAFHPAMEPNLQQTYKTPAAYKNKAYFMWDFVGRTLCFLYIVPATLHGVEDEDGRFVDGPFTEYWSDITSRNVLAKELMPDTKPGMLDMLLESAYPGGTGPIPTFGEEILQDARALV